MNSKVTNKTKLDGLGKSAAIINIVLSSVSLVIGIVYFIISLLGATISYPFGPSFIWPTIATLLSFLLALGSLILASLAIGFKSKNKMLNIVAALFLIVSSIFAIVSIIELVYGIIWIVASMIPLILSLFGKQIDDVEYIPYYES